MMKKHIPLLVILTFIVTMSVTNTNAIKKEDEEFKNLQVLPKNIKEEALDSIMDHFAVSLGVKCSFCHSRNADSTIKKMDWASDAKEEKLAARAMMKMTASINANFFNWQNSNRPDTIRAVVCYTCHRGNAEPDASVFLSQIDSIEQAHRKNH